MYKLNTLSSTKIFKAWNDVVLLVQHCLELISASPNAAQKVVFVVKTGLAIQEGSTITCQIHLTIILYSVRRPSLISFFIVVTVIIIAVTVIVVVAIFIVFIIGHHIFETEAGAPFPSMAGTGVNRNNSKPT